MIVSSAITDSNSSSATAPRRTVLRKTAVSSITPETSVAPLEEKTSELPTPTTTENISMTPSSEDAPLTTEDSVPDVNEKENHYYEMALTNDVTLPQDSKNAIERVRSQTEPWAQALATIKGVDEKTLMHAKDLAKTSLTLFQKQGNLGLIGGGTLLCSGLVSSSPLVITLSALFGGVNRKEITETVSDNFTEELAHFYGDLSEAPESIRTLSQSETLVAISAAITSLPYTFDHEEVEQGGDDFTIPEENIFIPQFPDMETQASDATGNIESVDTLLPETETAPHTQEQVLAVEEVAPKEDDTQTSVADASPLPSEDIQSETQEIHAEGEHVVMEGEVATVETTPSSPSQTETIVETAPESKREEVTPLPVQEGDAPSQFITLTKTQLFDTALTAAAADIAKAKSFFSFGDASTRIKDSFIATVQKNPELTVNELLMADLTVFKGKDGEVLKEAQGVLKRILGQELLAKEEVKNATIISVLSTTFTA